MAYAMSGPRQLEAETAWVRVLTASDLHTGAIVQVISSTDATALSEGDTNYFLGKLRDDPRGYDYYAVAIGTPSRYLVKTSGQCYVIKATKQRK